jgi:hypothetical protein
LFSSVVSDFQRFRGREKKVASCRFIVLLSSIQSLHSFCPVIISFLFVQKCYFFAFCSMKSPSRFADMKKKWLKRNRSCRLEVWTAFCHAIFQSKKKKCPSLEPSCNTHIALKHTTVKISSNPPLLLASGRQRTSRHCMIDFRTMSI